MKKLIIKHFSFELMQRKWGRKFIGGKFYYMGTGLSMAPFWTHIHFSNCQSVILDVEYYA